MGLEFDNCIIGSPEDREGMTEGSMDPLNWIRGCQDRASNGGLALAHLDSVVSQNDESLCCLSVNRAG